MSIKKAVFVVAGFGTRFLPATKAQPKEMLPIVNKPIIQYLVEEAVEAGIEEVIFVTARGKNSIENHFDKSYELDDILTKKGKDSVLEEVSKIANLAKFAYVRQPEQHGDGHAFLCAKPFIREDESVLVVFPDYLMSPETKAIQKIIDIYNKTKRPVVCADIVPKDKVSGYGVIDFEEAEDASMVKIKKFVEKPKVEEAPSNLISAGYFVLTPELIATLEDSLSTTADGEIRIADALTKMCNEGKDLYAFRPDKPGYDCGSILGFLKATVDFGLRREDLGKEFKEFLASKIN